MIGNLDDETNFPHKFLLTNRQVANLRQAFAKYLSTDIIILDNYIFDNLISVDKYLPKA